MRMEDHRVSLIDQKIEKICLGNDTYRINGLIGRGGICLVYQADKMIGDVKHRVVLKEFNPILPDKLNVKIVRDDMGNLIIPEYVWEYKDFAIRKERFLNSYHQMEYFHREEDTNNHMVNAEAIIEGYGTYYLVISYDNAETFGQYMEHENLENVVRILRKVAEAMVPIHNKNYVHLDLKPENILVFDKDFYIKIMDTDSLVTENEIKYGIASLSISDGYSAPELKKLQDSDILVRMSYAKNAQRFDIYSMGAILYQYLFDFPWIDQENSEYPNEQDVFLQVRTKDAFCQRHAIALIYQFLKHTLHSNRFKRYVSMEQTVAALKEIEEHIEKKVQIQDNFHENNEHIFGRENQLNEMYEAFNNCPRKGRVICVSGIHGIGKSSLAREYASRHQDEYDVIAEISAYSAKDAIMTIPLIYDDEENLTQSCDFRKKQIIDAMYHRNVLLIVNDYNENRDENFHIWQELSCDVILTSIHDWPGINCIHLGVMDLCNSSVQIFKDAFLWNARNVRDKSGEAYLEKLLDNEQMAVEILVKNCCYHPLTIRLLGKQMACVPNYEITPKEMAEKIEMLGIGKFDNEEFQYLKDSRVQFGDISKHFIEIYKTAAEKLNAKEIQALKFLSFLPEGYEGISAERFARWTGTEREGAKILNMLYQKGWLDYYPNKIDILGNANRTGIYILPMAVSELISNIMTDDDKAIILKLIVKMLFCESQIFIARPYHFKYVQIYAYMRAIRMILHRYGDLGQLDFIYSAIQCLYFENEMDIENSICKMEDSVQKYAWGVVDDYIELLRNMIKVCIITGKYEKGLYYAQRALKFTETYYTKLNSRFIINSIDMGRVYWAMGNIKAAISAEEDVLNIAEKIGVLKSHYMLVVYQDLFYMHLSSQNLEQAAVYKDKYTTLAFILYGEGSNEYSYRHVMEAEVLMEQRQYNECLEHLEAAIELLAHSNDDVLYMQIRAYMDAKMVLENLGNLEKSNIYAKKSMDLKKSLYNTSDKKLKNEVFYILAQPEYGFSDTMWDIDNNKRNYVKIDGSNLFNADYEGIKLNMSMIQMLPFSKDNITIHACEIIRYKLDNPTNGIMKMNYRYHIKVEGTVERLSKELQQISIEFMNGIDKKNTESVSLFINERSIQDNAFTIETEILNVEGAYSQYMLDIKHVQLYPKSF